VPACSSISDQQISSIALNCTGDWVALGCVGLGQLLVWEWQSETYVMKQQGHFNNMTCFAYSPDGQYIVTGGEDGKVSICQVIQQREDSVYINFCDHAKSVFTFHCKDKGKGKGKVIPVLKWVYWGSGGIAPLIYRSQH
jgi:WD40 repeat protein